MFAESGFFLSIDFFNPFKARITTVTLSKDFFFIEALSTLVTAFPQNSWRLEKFPALTVS